MNDFLSRLVLDGCLLVLLVVLYPIVKGLLERASMRTRIYDTTELILCEYEFDVFLCQLKLEVEYSEEHYVPATEEHAAYGGYVEAQRATIMRATLLDKYGNQHIAREFELAQIQWQLDRDNKAKDRIQELLASVMEDY